MLSEKNSKFFFSNVLLTQSILCILLSVSIARCLMSSLGHTTIAHPVRITPKCKLHILWYLYIKFIVNICSPNGQIYMVPPLCLIWFGLMNKIQAWKKHQQFPCTTFADPVNDANCQCNDYIIYFHCKTSYCAPGCCLWAVYKNWKGHKKVLVYMGCGGLCYGQGKVTN
jgi:hypothetical protein